MEILQKCPNKILSMFGSDTLYNDGPQKDGRESLIVSEQLDTTIITQLEFPPIIPCWKKRRSNEYKKSELSRISTVVNGHKMIINWI